MLNDEDNKNYYKTNPLLKFMRFFNLLEPDRNILSISKLATWIMLGVLCIALITMPDNLDAIFGAASGLIATLLNYSYRRWSQVNRGGRFRDDEDEDNEIPQRPHSRIAVDNPDEEQ